MTTFTMSRSDLKDATSFWWVFLVTGIFWLGVSLFVLQFDTTSITLVSVLMGIVFLLAGLGEIMTAALISGWRWFRVALGVVFAAGGIFAFANPEKTFVVVAALIAWLLLIRGTFDLIAALADTDVPLWWLQLVAGLAQILVGFWAVGWTERQAVLLLVWVGVSALTRGLIEIVFAFQLRAVNRGHSGLGIDAS